MLSLERVLLVPNKKAMIEIRKEDASAYKLCAGDLERQTSIPTDTLWGIFMIKEHGSLLFIL